MFADALMAEATRMFAPNQDKWEPLSCLQQSQYGELPGRRRNSPRSANTSQTLDYSEETVQESRHKSSNCYCSLQLQLEDPDRQQQPAMFGLFLLFFTHLTLTWSLVLKKGRRRNKGTWKSYYLISIVKLFSRFLFYSYYCNYVLFKAE